MTRQVEFDNFANMGKQRYELYLQNIVSSYNRVVLGERLNFKSIKQFGAEINDIANRYLTIETEELNKLYNYLYEALDVDTDKLSNTALEDETWETYLDDNIKFLYEAIKIQVNKDRLYASNFLRSKVLQIMSLNDYEAAHELVFNYKELSFFYTDKIGRKVNSVKYIRTMYRDTLVKNYNDLMVGSAILSGKENVGVSHLDINHKHHDLILPITNEKNDLNYFTIREEVFHPNTNAIVIIGD